MLTAEQEGLPVPILDSIDHTQDLYSPTYIQNGYHEGVHDLLKSSRELQITREYAPSTVVLVPLHNDPHRVEVMDIVFQSIADQEMGNFRVVIADNGITEDQAESVHQKAANSGFSVDIVNARGNTEREKSPAYARNTALREIRGKAEQDDEYRGDVFLLDSDCAVLPGALQNMRDSLYTNSDAVAVSADVRSVEHLTEEVYLDQNARTKGGHVVVLPTVWTPDKKIDLGSIVAFSSQVAGKTTGLLMNRDVVWDITDYASELYIPMPNKSAEDMIASCALNKYGRILQDSRAVVLDEVRQNPDQVMQQQLRWGKDHSLLAECLNTSQLLETGLHVLEPQGETWTEWVVPGTEWVNGYVINPQDVFETAEVLESFSHEIQDPRFAEVVAEGLKTLRQSLRLIEARRKFGEQDLRIRSDLPRPTASQDSSARFSSYAKASRLAGNILGMYDLYDMSRINAQKSLPPTILFGGRQSASWGSGS